MIFLGLVNNSNSIGSKKHSYLNASPLPLYKFNSGIVKFVRDSSKIKRRWHKSGECVLDCQLNRELIIYKQLNFTIFQFYNLLFPMHSEELYEDDLTRTIKPRNFKCPCGKTYLSYAALFTHIKQKHEGKPPGKITKPPSLHEKRGRPPIKPKHGKREQETDIPQVSYQPLFPPQTEEQKTRREAVAERAISQLAQLLDRMPEDQLNKSHLNEIEVFSEMNVYLNTRMGSCSLAKGNICIADGFIEFAQTVCERIFWRSFEPFYLLFMLFIQYIIDEENTKKVLTESNMDLLCEYVNEFIEEHAREMAEYYELQNLWVMQKENSIRVFFNFFSWCTHRRYVTYKINLATQVHEKGQGKEDRPGTPSH